MARNNCQVLIFYHRILLLHQTKSNDTLHKRASTHSCVSTGGYSYNTNPGYWLHVVKEEQQHTYILPLLKPFFVLPLQ